MARISTEEHLAVPNERSQRAEWNGKDEKVGERIRSAPEAQGMVANLDAFEGDPPPYLRLSVVNISPCGSLEPFCGQGL